MFNWGVAPLCGAALYVSIFFAKQKIISTSIANPNVQFLSKLFFN